MARSDAPAVYWKHYAYGYEARLAPYGPAFARARMVQGVPGVHYELVWIHGPRRWRPMQVFNVMKIERLVDRYVRHHRESLKRKMPPDPMRIPRTQLVAEPQVEDLYVPRCCPDCGRVWGVCARTLAGPERRKGGRGWPCQKPAS